jgi:hypothetical protein
MKSVARPDDLIDEELSAVCFVRDYVELHFDGPILRALAPLRFTSHSGRDMIAQGAAGWRDDLCSLIDLEVEDVIMDENKAITLRFIGGDQITIPLDPESRVGLEAAHFVPYPRAPLIVW